MTPQQEISRMKRRAISLRDQALQQLSTGMHDPLSGLVGDIIVKKIVPHGLKGRARKIGHSAKRRDKDDQNAYWRQEGAHLVKECESIVGTISQIKMNLTPRGNSPQLKKKFNRVKKLKGAVPFLTTLITVLEELEGMDLIWNQGIKEELARRREEEKQLKLEKAQLRKDIKDIIQRSRAVDIYDTMDISKRLKDHIDVSSPLIGAIDRLQTNDPEAERHCISSCRIAIEALCRKLGGEADYKKALNNIFSEESDRKQVKKFHHFLSGKGSHAGHEPTQKEAEECLKRTIGTLEFLLDARSDA